MNLRKALFCIILFILTKNSGAQNSDSLYIDSLIRNGAIIEADPHDNIYAARKGAWLHTGMISESFDRVAGGYASLMFDLGHVPYNRIDWHNRFWYTHLTNILKLHQVDFVYTDHFFLSYNFRAPLLSFRFVTTDKKGRNQYFALYGNFANNLHFNEGLVYYSLGLAPSLQIKNLIFTFTYDGKPYFKKITEQNHKYYEDYLNDQEVLKRERIRTEHINVQLRLAYIFKL